MPLTLGWGAIAIRLGLTLAAGALFGWNRKEHARPAGLRTTMLVCLAASVSMIQVNLLLPLADRSPSSFIMMDLMRLPLGILSGMGFIGAGAILRRNDLVHGVTTAATLWFVTVIGLCLGGGQLRLGSAATVLGFLVLDGLKRVERTLPQERNATLSLTTLLEGSDGLSEDEIRRTLEEAGLRLAWSAVAVDRSENRRRLTCAIRWRSRARDEEHPPALVDRLGADPRVLQIRWSPDAV